MLYPTDSGIHRLDLQDLISQACSEQSEFPEKEKKKNVEKCPLLPQSTAASWQGAQLGLS